MNTSIEDLIFSCEREKLHLSNAIQPFGVLAVVSEGDRRITHVSANAGDLTDLSPDQVLGEEPQVLFETCPNLDVGVPTSVRGRRLIFGIHSRNGKSIDLAVIETPGGRILELQEALPSIVGRSPNLDFTRVLGTSGRRIRLADISRRVAEMVKKASGFEKVMIYRFHKDWTGEVIEEVGGDPLFDEYMGLRFPASDIPKIARDLYRDNPYRLIADATAAPVPLLSRDPDLPTPDLTHAELRSVSPVHMEYLANMNVQASFSLSVVVGGELWGLIACHHPEPRYLSLETRIACAELAKGYMVGLMTERSNRRIAYLETVDGNIERLTDKIGTGRHLSDGLKGVEQDVLNLMDASGAALVHQDDTLVTFGTVPDEDQIRSFDGWFMAECEESILLTDHIAGLVESAAEWAVDVSGVAAVRALVHGRTDRWVRFYWFRPELPRVIHWAGDPSKPMKSDGTSTVASPRASFKKWSQSMTGHSEEWTSLNQLTATKFRAVVLLKLCV